MENVSQVADLTEDDLKGLLNDQSVTLAHQVEILNEFSRRAAFRRKAEEVAELVATDPVMAALDRSAEMVREAQAWLDHAKWVRAKAVQSALAANYTLRTVAEVARVAPSTAMRLGAQEHSGEPPPVGILTDS